VPDEPWFKLRARDAELNDLPSVGEWCAEMERLISRSPELQRLILEKIQRLAESTAS